jgi:hypothetical protein
VNVEAKTSAAARCGRDQDANGEAEWRFLNGVLPLVMASWWQRGCLWVAAEIGAEEDEAALT